MKMSAVLFWLAVPSIWFAVASAAAADEIPCAGSECETMQQQTDSPPGIGGTKAEALCDAMQNWRDALFTCEPCEDPKQGCNLSGPSFEDPSGNPITMKEFKDGEWVFHSEWTQVEQLSNGCWSAAVTLPAGARICAACSPCTEPL